MIGRTYAALCRPSDPTSDMRRIARHDAARSNRWALVPQPSPARRDADLPRTTGSAISPPSSGSRSPRICPQTSPAGRAWTSAATPASTASSWPGAAAQVLGIDVDERYLRQARWAADAFGLADRVPLRADAGLRPGPPRTSGSTWCSSWACSTTCATRCSAWTSSARRSSRLLVFQTLTMPGEEVFEQTYDRGFDDRRPACCDPGWPKMAFLEHHFAGDPTNWWAPNHAGVEAMLRSAGMRVIGRPGHEIYLCEPDPRSRRAWRPGTPRSSSRRRDRPSDLPKAGTIDPAEAPVRPSTPSPRRRSAAPDTPAALQPDAPAGPASASASGFTSRTTRRSSRRVAVAEAS